MIAIKSCNDRISLNSQKLKAKIANRYKRRTREVIVELLKLSDERNDEANNI